MNDNEKCAHDLALASIPLYLNTNFSLSTKEGEGIASYIYKIYTTAYKRYLDSFNRDFPIS